MAHLMRAANFTRGTETHREEYDFAVKVDNWGRRCHRSALGDASPMFKAMFTDRWSTSYTSNQKAEIQLPVGSPAIVDLVIDAVYGQRLEINEGNFEDILEVADYLDLTNLVFDCKEFIKSVMVTNANCFQLWHVSTWYTVGHPTIEKFIRRNIRDLHFKPGMLNIREDLIKAVLSDETLMYWPGVEKFRCLVAWCDEFEQRAAAFPKLFELINIDRVSLQFVDYIMKSESLVSENKDCLKRVKKRIRDGDENVPYLLITTERSNDTIFGLNTIDQNWCRVKFSPAIIQSSISTAVGSDGVVYSIDEDRQSNNYRMPVYNINTDLLKHKLFSNDDNTLVLGYTIVPSELDEDKSLLVEELKFMFVTNDRVCFAQLQEQKEYTHSGMHRSTQRRVTRSTTTIYQSVKENSVKITVEPIVSFPFEIYRRCLSANASGMYISRTCTDVWKSAKNTIMFYSPRNNALTEIEIGSHLDLSRDDDVTSLVAIQNGCILFCRWSVIHISDENALTPCIRHVEKRQCAYLEHDCDYLCFNNTLYSFQDGELRSYKFVVDKYDLSSWETVNYQHGVGKSLKYKQHPLIIGVFLKRTHPLCHVNCPHCLPEVEEENEEQGVKRDDEIKE